MIGSIRRRGFVKAGLAAGVAALCQPVRAHEYFAPHFTLIHPWTRASAPGATSAIVCMTFENVTETDRLVGASTPVADGAQTGGPGAGPALNIVIAQGKTTELTEEGVHLRLVRLTQPIQIGREYPLSLLFEKAGRLKASFLVDYPAA